MFKSFRFRIAIWFVCLSALVYVAITAAGMLFFQSRETSELDVRLQTTARELIEAIDYTQGVPHFPNWIANMYADPEHSLYAVELYDPQGHLLQSFGRAGLSQLILEKKEVTINGHDRRIVVKPLVSNNQVRGYLEVQLPARSRNSNVYQFGLTMAILAPFLLAGLGVSGYIVSGKAVAPIAENMKMLRQFLADAGHELNTPLTIIQARTETLERKLERQGVSTDELNVIRASTERMEKIVNDLMLLAEIEGPMVASPKQAIQDDRMIKSIIDQNAERFKEKGITLSCDAIEPIQILGWPDSFERMLNNLLENALRYTDSGGSVKIKTISDGHLAHISVEDTGIGIPSESLPFIFDRFYRVDKSRSRASGGAGLGLSIVSAIAGAHDGKIEVESQPGKGSIFTIVVPVQA